MYESVNGEVLMSEETWVEHSLSEARRHALPAPDTVWTWMETLLKGRLGQQPLTGMELQSIAMQLMNETTIPAEENQQ